LKDADGAIDLLPHQWRMMPELMDQTRWLGAVMRHLREYSAPMISERQYGMLRNALKDGLVEEYDSPISEPRQTESQGPSDSDMVKFINEKLAEWHKQARNNGWPDLFTAVELDEDFERSMPLNDVWRELLTKTELLPILILDQEVWNSLPELLRQQVKAGYQHDPFVAHPEEYPSDQTLIHYLDDQIVAVWQKMLSTFFVSESPKTDPWGLQQEQPLITNGIQTNFFVAGMLQDYAEVVLQASLAEGWGMTATEALSKGLLIANRVGGLAKQLMDDDGLPTGFGVNVDALDVIIGYALYSKTVLENLDDDTGLARTVIEDVINQELGKTLREIQNLIHAEDFDSDRHAMLVDFINDLERNLRGDQIDRNINVLMGQLQKVTGAQSYLQWFADGDWVHNLGMRMTDVLFLPDGERQALIERASQFVRTNNSTLAGVISRLNTSLRALSGTLLTSQHLRPMGFEKQAAPGGILMRFSDESVRVMGRLRFEPEAMRAFWMAPDRIQYEVGEPMLRGMERE
jgi:hypothetical protein